jgi:hypothetical protein
VAPVKKEEEDKIVDSCSDDAKDAINVLLQKYDGRLVATVLMAESALIAATFRREKVWDTEYICGMFCEGLTVALTFESKAKMMLTDGKDTGSRQ